MTDAVFAILLDYSFGAALGEILADYVDSRDLLTLTVNGCGWSRLINPIPFVLTRSSFWLCNC